MNIQRKTAGKAEGPKIENLHVALVADLKADARCAAATPSAVFTGDADGPLRAYSASDGQGQLFVERERDKAVNCVCVVNGSNLWVGGASGDLAVFTLATGEKKVKPFLAHDKGVWTIVNVRGKFVVTGGADFQVKVWSLACESLHASGQHSGAVKCILSFPASTDGSQLPAVWSGAQVRTAPHPSGTTG